MQNPKRQSRPTRSNQGQQTNGQIRQHVQGHPQPPQRGRVQHKKRPPQPPRHGALKFQLFLTIIIIIAVVGMLIYSYYSMANLVATAK